MLFRSESFFATFKKELIYRHTWPSQVRPLAEVDAAGTGSSYLGPRTVAGLHTTYGGMSRWHLYKHDRA